MALIASVAVAITMVMIEEMLAEEMIETRKILKWEKREIS